MTDTDTTVPEGTIAEVTAWVGGDPARAAVALDAEQASDSPRKSLVAALDQIANPPADTPDTVLDAALADDDRWIPDGWEPSYEGEELPRKSDNTLSEPAALTDERAAGLYGIGTEHVAHYADGEWVEYDVDPTTGQAIVGESAE